MYVGKRNNNCRHCFNRVTTILSKHSTLCTNQKPPVLVLVHYFALYNSLFQVFDIKEKLECYADAKRCLVALNEDAYCEQLSDSIRLLKFSVKLEDELNQSLSHMSLRELFIWLIEHGHNASAESLRKDFRITDKQYDNIFIYSRIISICSDIGNGKSKD